MDTESEPERLINHIDLVMAKLLLQHSIYDNQFYHDVWHQASNTIQ